MPLYYSPEIVKLVMSERLKEAESNRLAADSRPRGRSQFSFSLRRLFGLRPTASPIAQTCTC
jgi:hypothetical protein